MRLAFWCALVALYLLFRFWAWSEIAICDHFCSPAGVYHPCSVVPVGALGPFSPGNSPFWAGWPFLGCGELAGCIQNRGLDSCAPRLLGFILLVSFSDTLLVVSILDIV